MFLEIPQFDEIDEIDQLEVVEVVCRLGVERSDELLDSAPACRVGAFQLNNIRGSRSFSDSGKDRQ